MPNSTIPGLPAAPSINANALFAISQDVGGGPTTYKVPFSDLQANVVTTRVATNYTSSGERYIIITDVTTAPTPRTVTLSTADFNNKAVVTVKDATNGAGTNSIIVITQAAETIDETLSRSSINTDNGELTFASDGTTWQIIGHDDSIVGEGFERITTDSVGISQNYRKARADGAGNPVIIANADNLLKKEIFGYDGVNYISCGELQWDVGGAPSASDIPTTFTFRNRKTAGTIEDIFNVDINNTFNFVQPMTLTTKSLAVNGNTSGAQMVFVTDTSVPRTITLSSSSVIAGMITDIKDASLAAGTNNITIDTEGAELIDGVATATISANGGVLRVVGDGTNFLTR